MVCSHNESIVQPCMLAWIPAPLTIEGLVTTVCAWLLRKTPTTLPQYKRKQNLIFQHWRESVSKSRREVETVTTELVTSTSLGHKCCTCYFIKTAMIVQ